MRKILFIVSFIVSFTASSQVQVGTNFRVMTNLPIDTRMTVKTITDRNALPSMYRYVGLCVFVEADSSFYTLMSGKSNSDWRIEGVTPTNTVTIDRSNCSNAPKTDYQICIEQKGSNYAVYISFKGSWIKIK